MIKKAAFILILVYPSLCQIRISDAAVREIVLHLNSPSEGVEIRQVLDISQIVNIGEPQVLPAQGMMLYTDEMAGAMADLDNILKDYGPVTLKVDHEEP